MSPRFLGYVVGIISLIWGALFAWDLVIDASPNQFSINSPEMKQRLANCSGSFEQRQSCAEKIAEELQQRGFLAWSKNLAIILGPPVVLWTLLGVYNRQRDREPAEPRPLPARRIGGQAPAGQRRVRSVEEESRFDRPNSGREPPPLDPYPERPSGPGPAAPSHPPGMPGEAPIFTGGRREPIRRRDR